MTAHSPPVLTRRIYLLDIELSLLNNYLLYPDKHSKLKYKLILYLAEHTFVTLEYFYQYLSNTFS